MLRFGMCAGRDKAPLLAQAGADYIELAVGSELMGPEAEANWPEQRQKLQALPLPIGSFFLFVRGGLRIVGPDEQRTDAETLRQYVLTAMERVAELGAKVIVFGSSGARNVPEGFPREKAQEQIREFLRYCAEGHEKTGTIIAIEPLNRGESNIINSVREAAVDYAIPLNHPGIRVLADTYHMELENEPVSVIEEFAPYIVHIHTADTGRVAPGTNGYDHVALFRALRAIDYDGRVSIEGKIDDLSTELAPALAHLRRSYETAASAAL